MKGKIQDTKRLYISLFQDTFIVSTLPGGKLLPHFQMKEAKNANIKHIRVCSAVKWIPHSSISEHFSFWSFYLGCLTLWCHFLLLTTSVGQQLLLPRYLFSWYFPVLLSDRQNDMLISFVDKSKNEAFFSSGFMTSLPWAGLSNLFFLLFNFDLSC